MFTADKHNIFEKKKPFGASSHDRKKLYSCSRRIRLTTQ